MDNRIEELEKRVEGIQSSVKGYVEGNFGPEPVEFVVFKMGKANMSYLSPASKAE